MAIAVMVEVWKHSSTKGSELLVMLALADWADEHAAAWPGVDTLAAKTRLSRRQTQMILSSLVQQGELTILVQGGGRNRSTRYRLTPGNRAEIAPFPVAENRAAQRAKQCSLAHETVQCTAPDTLDTSDTAERALSAKPKPKPKRKPLTEIDEAFEPPQSEIDKLMLEQHLSAAVIAFETVKFRDHFIGNGKMQRDWIAVWRNWIRNAAQYLRAHGTAPASAAVAEQPLEPEQYRAPEGRDDESPLAALRELERGA